MWPVFGLHTMKRLSLFDHRLHLHCVALLARPCAAGLTFSSGLLAALLDLPPADGSQSDEQHQQTHSQADSNPQSHGRERNVLT